MKFECGKCGTKFDAKTDVRCPECGEVNDVQVIYEHHHPDMEVSVHEN